MEDYKTAPHLQPLGEDASEIINYSKSPGSVYARGGTRSPNIIIDINQQFFKDWKQEEREFPISKYDISGKTFERMYSSITRITKDNLDTKFEYISTSGGKSTVLELTARDVLNLRIASDRKIMFNPGEYYPALAQAIWTLPITRIPSRFTVEMAKGNYACTSCSIHAIKNNVVY